MRGRFSWRGASTHCPCTLHSRRLKRHQRQPSPCGTFSGTGTTVRALLRPTLAGKLRSVRQLRAGRPRTLLAPPWGACCRRSAIARSSQSRLGTPATSWCFLSAWASTAWAAQGSGWASLTSQPSSAQPRFASPEHGASVSLADKKPTPRHTTLAAASASTGMATTFTGSCVVTHRSIVGRCRCASSCALAAWRDGGNCPTAGPARAPWLARSRSYMVVRGIHEQAASPDQAAPLLRRWRYKQPPHSSCLPPAQACAAHTA